MSGATIINGARPERSDIVRALRAAALKFANEAGKTGQHPELARVLKIVAADYRGAADYIQKLEADLAGLKRANQLLGAAAAQNDEAGA
jgi:hypothetical protein